MSSINPIQLLDVSIRDGSNLINHQYEPKNVADIARGIATAGIEWIEVSHGLGIGSRMMGLPGLVDDEELLEAANEAAPEAKFSVFIQPNEYSVPLIPGLADYFSLGRVGFRFSCLGAIEKIINKLKKNEKKVSLQLIGISRKDFDWVAKAAQQATELGADILYIVDSYGNLSPSQVSNFVKVAIESCKLPIGFHGHNNYQMAVPNTLAAYEAGATWLDASLMGIGRGAGNAALLPLIASLQVKGQLKSIDLNQINETIHRDILPIFKSAPGSSLLDILLARHQVSFEPSSFFQLISHSLHIPLIELIAEVEEQAKEREQVDADDLKAVVEKRGHNFDQFIKTLNQ